MSDYTTDDRVTVYGQCGTVLRLIPGTEIYAIDLDNGRQCTATAVAMAPADAAAGRITVHCTCGWYRNNVVVPDDLDANDPLDIRDLKIGTIERYHGDARGSAHRML